ncbi:MAG: universal stress protein [Chloroflexota bacterium]
MKVIFATDFYAASVTARALLTRLNWSFGTRLELLHVLPPPRRSGWFGSGGHGPETLETARRELRLFGHDLAARVEDARGSVQQTILVGDPATSILQRALTIGADLIVIGGPGRAESASRELSPLSATVASQAHCSVLIARTERVEHLLVDADPREADEAEDQVARSPLLRSMAVSASRRDVADDDGDVLRALSGLEGSVLIWRGPADVPAHMSEMASGGRGRA